MKPFVISFAIVFFYLNINAQSIAKILSKDHPVKSTQWGMKSTSFVDGYWEMVRPQLLKKFTKKLVDSIETYSMSMYYPAASVLPHLTL